MVPMGKWEGSYMRLTPIGGSHFPNCGEFGVAEDTTGGDFGGFFLAQPGEVGHFLGRLLASGSRFCGNLFQEPLQLGTRVDDHGAVTEEFGGLAVVFMLQLRVNLASNDQDF